MWTLIDKVRAVILACNSTPSGQIIDADTLLADVIENADYEISDMFKEIAETWMTSEDQRGIEVVFEVLTGTNFEEFVDKCLALTTKPK